jgi:PhnB protein
MSVHPVPKGYHTITPYFTVEKPGKFIDFVVAAFGATIIDIMATPEGNVMHAELKIGDSPIMVGGPRGEWTAMPLQLYMYFPDCDAVVAKAIAAGATLAYPVSDQFYGDRNGCVKDAWGNLWSVATHIEDVPKDEMLKRAAAFHGAPSATPWSF